MSEPRGFWSWYFFPTASPVRLAFMRIVCAALQLLWFAEPLSAQLAKLNAPGFDHPQMIVRGFTAVVPVDALRSGDFLTALYWGTFVVGVLALVGLLTRVTMLLFALGTILQIAHLYSYGEHHHPEAAYCVFLFMLGLAPCGRALSVDAWLAKKRGGSTAAWGPDARLTTVMWPIVAIQVFLALAYFDSFMSKVVVGGLDWINGYTLQTYLLQDGIRWDRPAGVFLAQYRWAGVLFAVGALAFEALFFVVLFARCAWFRRIPGWRLVVPAFLLAGACMHLTIWIAQAAPFFQFLVLYLTWVPWERLWNRRRASSETSGSMDTAVPGPGLRTQSASAAPAA